MSSGVSSTSRASAAHSRRTRKNRQLMVPADTLLNFARYHPRTGVDYTPTRTPKRQAAPRRREQFVQANYQFAVDPHYDEGFADCVALPDAVIPWSSVDLVFMHHSYDCPICLHPLRCPRVTPCGHVFDFVCMLQHLSHSANVDGFAKCPLCFSRVSTRDLRACVFRDASLFEVGLPCTMRLVSRERGCMIAHAHPTNCYRQIPNAVASDVPLFSRLSFADENYLLELTADSIQDLRQTKQDDHTLALFVDAAMESLKENKKVYRMRRSASRRAQSDQQHGCQSSSDCKRSLATRREPWYFYQARDSRNIFLHPVNHRCISTEVSGDFSRVESEICGEVLQIERHTMNEQLRKRYRFLEHLPVGCDFCFVELDLSHIMSEETKAAHHGELRERSFARRRREIATAKEDMILERKRSESLHEYFGTQAEYITQPVPSEAVDSRDVTSFPALRVNPGCTAENEDGDSEITTETQVPGMSLCPTVNAWGADVSSYSSVTSNMGLFPSLTQTTAPSSEEVSPKHLENRESRTFSRQSLSPGVTRHLFSSPVESRKGRKSHGRTTILLSNLGSPYRR